MAMDFFDQQHRTQQKTKWLVFVFILAVICIVLVVHVLLAMVLDLPLTDWELLGYVALGVCAVVGLGSAIKMAELSQGGRVVATMLGGEPLAHNPTNPAEQRLWNIVEEMAIASGVPVPEVYVLPDRTINAFAAGHGPGDTAIGVTRGAIERLSRDQLQGVIAHEFSHILYGDMRLNIRLMGLLNGILCIALVGAFLLRLTIYAPSDSDSRDRKNGGGLIIAMLGLGIGLYLIGWIGVFFGNLIKAAVSRQREFLADASAVQFTRNPDGIAGALWNIGRSSSQLASPRAAEASHMYFGNGVSSAWFSLFATHPPVDERIKAIDPNFDPESVTPAAPPPPLPTGPQPPPLPGAQGFSSPAMAVGFAAALLESLPEQSAQAVRELHGACALVYSLLLDRDDNARGTQMDGLTVDPVMQRHILDFFIKNRELQGAQRITLVDLAIPTLRQLSPAQYEEFRKNVRHLVESDQQIDLFEYVLQKILLRHLDLYFSNSTGTTVRYRAIVPVLPDVAVLLTALSMVGHEDQASQEAAFEAGVRELLVNTTSHPMARVADCDLTQVDKALDRIGESAPDVKKRVLFACSQTVAHDGVVESREYEVLRAIADTLDCPMPPLPPPMA